MEGFLVRALAKWCQFLYRKEGLAPFWIKWANFSIPHRPTKKEVEIYRDFLSNDLSPEPEFLILGATPELRDLAAELGVRPVVVDISLGMLYGMMRYAKTATVRNEIWVRSDWEDVPLQENFFDIVAGDLFLRHLEPRKQEGVMAKIFHLLRPGGRVIVRVHVLNPRYLDMAYQEILDETKLFPYREKKYEAMGLLLSRLFDRSTQNQRTVPGNIRASVEEYIWHQKAPLAYKLFLNEFLIKRFYRLGENLTSQTREEIENLFNKFFRIIDLKFDGTYPESEFYPIYLLEKKK